MSSRDAVADSSQAAIETSIVDEVLANLFQAIVDEMASQVLRSAYTTFIKETQDFGTGLVTPSGELFAYPGALGAKSLMGIHLGAGVDPALDWEPGDVLITNDPYSTRGMVMHLNDFYVFRPIFVDGRVIAFSWGFIHATDVGGRVPGSIAADSREIFEEGLILRPTKLYHAGRLDQSVRRIIEDNCRIPADNWGDISALVAAVTAGEKRVLRLVEKYGADAISRAMEATLASSERLAKTALRAIPAGEYSFTEYFEDDYVSKVPVRIQVTLKSDGEGQITLDFNGSDPQVRSAVNLPSGGQRHNPMLSRAITNFVATFAQGVRLNAGIIRCVDLELPAGSIVNCSAPAACGLRIVTVMKVHDAVLACLSQAVPDKVPAAGAGQVVITYVSRSEAGRSGRVVVANPVQGGSGGGPLMDGVSGADRPVAFLRNVPAEVLETEAPVRVAGFGLMPDSEGPGKFRGGFGIRFDLQVTDPTAFVVLRGQDRHVFNPWGVHGGHAGTNAACIANYEGHMQSLGKVSTHRPRLGETLTIIGAGGGGFGDPLERDPERVLTDHLNGLVSRERARDVYGVVIEEGAVDEAATTELRASRATGEDRTMRFDVGGARTRWEERHRNVLARIHEWVWSLPAALRTQAKEYVFTGLADLGDGVYTLQQVESVIATFARPSEAAGRR